MTDKCKYCGSGPLGFNDPMTPYFECWMPNDNLQSYRTHKCLETQLAQQKELLRDAERTIWDMELVLQEYEHGDWLFRGPSLCLKRLHDIVNAYRKAFCGAEQSTEELRPIEAYRGVIDWCCGTSYYGEGQGYGSRGEQCYETQLTRQRELLRRCEEVVRWAASWQTMPWDNDINRQISEAQSLLPDLERALEEK
jgi:hypothetical protein